MRPIDKDKLITSVAWHDQQGMISTIDDVLDIIEAFPTLTPQNEPLTWNELETMTNNPVYIVELERPNRCYWALVHKVSGSGVMLTSAIDLNDYGSHELYGQSWLAYRRPPERQEDT